MCLCVYIIVKSVIILYNVVLLINILLQGCFCNIILFSHCSTQVLTLREDIHHPEPSPVTNLPVSTSPLNRGGQVDRNHEAPIIHQPVKNMNEQTTMEETTPIKLIENELAKPPIAAPISTDGPIKLWYAQLSNPSTHGVELAFIAISSSKGDENINEVA